MGSYGLLLETLFLSFRVSPVPLMSLFGWWMSVFLLTKCSSYWPLPLPSALGNSTPCRFMSITPRVGVRHPFVSLRASWQNRGLRGFVYRPYLSRALILTLDSYVRCERSGVTWPALLRIVLNASGCSSPQDVSRRRSLRTRSPSGSGR